jgi:predicted anti-sigma-YlaC factor YlaD
MNNHLPYREWIFEEDPLPADTGQELHKHLQNCAECRTLADRWNSARGMMTDAGMKAPRDGFAVRWKAFAEERLRAPSSKQAWALFAASSAGSLITALALAAQTSARGFSLAGVLTRDLSAAVGTIEGWMGTSNALGGFLDILSRSIPAAWYLFAVFFLGFIGVVWLLLIVRAHARGRK